MYLPASTFHMTVPRFLTCDPKNDGSSCQHWMFRQRNWKPNCQLNCQINFHFVDKTYVRTVPARTYDTE